MRTKIIATIGPASDSPDVLRGLIQAGVGIFRLNFSHGKAEDFAPLIERVRGLEAEFGREVTLLQDLSGPKIRIGELARQKVSVNKGDAAYLGLPSLRAMAERRVKAEGMKLDDKQAPFFIPLDEPRILANLAEADVVALSDGALQLTVAEALDDGLYRLKARNPGIVTSRKGIAFPGKNLPVAALTRKDMRDLAEGLKLGVDAVAVSYVQGPEDILEAKALVREHGGGAGETDRSAHVPVIAKLERQNAVDRVEEIIALADGVMVARGDLGLECPLPELPGMQKRIIRAANRAAKPVIVATQMLLSMVNNPVPTRAETTDVANAILDGADCLMLSEETAVGRHPVETVAVMREIAFQAEELFLDPDLTVQGRYFAPGLQALAGSTALPHTSPQTGSARTRKADPEDEGELPRFLAYAACLLADKAGAKALVSHTMSGASARMLAACRPHQPIYAIAPDPRVRHHLRFSRGVFPEAPVAAQPDAPGEPTDHLERAEAFIRHFHGLQRGDTAVLTAGQPKSGEARTATNVVKIYNK